MSSSNGSITAVRTGANGTAYSASVRLFLRQNGGQISLAQVGGGRLYFDEPMVLPAGPAEIIVEIDGEPRQTAVVISRCETPSRSVAYVAG